MNFHNNSYQKILKNSNRILIFSESFLLSKYKHLKVCCILFGKYILHVGVRIKNLIFEMSLDIDFGYDFHNTIHWSKIFFSTTIIKNTIFMIRTIYFKNGSCDHNYDYHITWSYSKFEMMIIEERVYSNILFHLKFFFLWKITCTYIFLVRKLLFFENCQNPLESLIISPWIKLIQNLRNSKCNCFIIYNDIYNHIDFDF